ncbi:MAG: flavodoxin [Oscillospiraceae bacterium]
MSKIAVIYWSGSGNTEQMALAVAEGAGADVFSVAEFSGKLSDYNKVAFGCSAMGDEVLEESEFEPFFASIESELAGKKIALFGSYGWGDGEWMRIWQSRVDADNAVLYTGEGLIVNEAPDGAALAQCKEFGAGFAAF